MKFLIVFVLAALNLYMPAAAQKSYRLKTVNGIEYMLPPGMRIAKEGIFGNRERLTYHRKFRYQRIIITGLSHRYDRNITSINNTVFEYGRKPIKLRIQHHSKIPYYRVDTSIPFCKIYYSNDSSKLLLEIDMDHVLKDKSLTEVSSYLKEQLLPGILRSFGRIEMANNTAAETQKVWAPGTTEYILEKILDRLPWPQGVANARFGHFSGGDCVSMLLTTSLKLRNDLATREFLKTGNPNHWQYTWYGTTYTDIFRDSLGAIKQIPYAAFSRTVLTGNRLRDTTVLIASSGDIQFSTSTVFRNYILFWQERMKRNTNQQGGNTEFDTDSTKGTSLLLHFDNPIELAVIYKSCIDARKHKVRSSAGVRNLSTAGFIIYVNNVPQFVPVASTLSILRLPQNTFWYRYGGNAYYRMSGAKNDTFLMPGDRFKTVQK